MLRAFIPLHPSQNQSPAVFTLHQTKDHQLTVRLTLYYVSPSACCISIRVLSAKLCRFSVCSVSYWSSLRYLTLVPLLAVCLCEFSPQNCVVSLAVPSHISLLSSGFSIGVVNTGPLSSQLRCSKDSSMLDWFS